MGEGLSNQWIIEAGSTSRHYWKELWNFRELFYILSWRDFKVRYKQTILGISWALLRPFLTMLLFAWVFGRLAGMATASSIPYTIIVFAGLLPWQFFSSAVTESSNSLAGNANLVTRIYFPRMIIPASTIFTAFIDFCIALALLGGLFIYYSYVPPVELVFLPFFIVLLVLASIGPGLYLTALNVKYRDFRYVIPFLIQVGLFVSPVGYSSLQVPENWRAVYALNPMSGIIDGFRWCIVKDSPNPLLDYPFYISMGMALLLFVVAIYQFRKMERHFADYI